MKDVIDELQPLLFLLLTIWAAQSIASAGHQIGVPPQEACPAVSATPSLGLSRSVM